MTDEEIQTILHDALYSAFEESAYMGRPGAGDYQAIDYVWRQIGDIEDFDPDERESARVVAMAGALVATALIPWQSAYELAETALGEIIEIEDADREAEAADQRFYGRP